MVYKKNNNKINKGKLPDFLIIGVIKGGTTSLFKNLRKHPEVEMNFPKELHFFDGINENKGLAWYKKNFMKKNKASGEATPEYIHNNRIHKKMHKAIPAARMILSVRNPIERAYSHWNSKTRKDLEAPEGASKEKWEIRKSFLKDTFGDKTFEQVISSALQKGGARGRLHKAGMIKKGFYIDQIESLLKYYKREQLLVLISEQVFKNPEREYKKIYEFLGAKDFRMKKFKKANASHYEKPINPKTRKLLEKLYKPYNERLYKFLTSVPLKIE